MKTEESTVAISTAAAPAASEPSQAEATRGFFFALSAYMLWGFLPLYMKAVAHIPSLEVLAHRIIWSVPVAGLVLFALGRTGDIGAALRSPRTLLMAGVTASIIAVNWLIYVWAISVERTVETALGYYINPLVTVLLGAALLGERLTRWQVIAVGLATLAVIVLTVDAGGLPWVSLALAFSFAAYGYLRKTLPIGQSQGFFLEVLLLTPLALGFLLWLWSRGEGHFLEAANPWLLMLAGPVTAAPLILYAFGAKLLRFSTIGIMQYSAPTMIAAIGVFVFGEPFGPARMIAFALIWAALALYTWSMFSGKREG
jgi:chloramphenicol-sensitive protein RarD